MQTTLELLGETELQVKRPFVLGVLGNRSKWTLGETVDVLQSIISEENCIPTALQIPAEGDSALFFEVWANNQKIDCFPIESEWTKHGRRARAIRDSKIMKDASHLLFFLNKRSEFYLKMAMREAKKGRVVYTIDNNKELAMWT
jgi:hypothetical protein